MNYSLSNHLNIWLHGSAALTVQDTDETIRPADIAVASGDYFATLATNLDTLASNLDAHGNEIAAQELRQVIHELLYIQTKYKITKK